MLPGHRGSAFTQPVMQAVGLDPTAPTQHLALAVCLHGHPAASAVTSLGSEVLGAFCLLLWHKSRERGLVHRAVLCTGEKGLPVAVAQAPWLSCTSAGSSAEDVWASHCHFSFSPGKGHCLVSSHLIRDHHLCATKSPQCCCIRRLCPCNCKSPKSSCDSCN